MNPNNHPVLEIQELSIVLTAKPDTSIILTLDFLKGSGIVPPDLELARPPVFTDHLNQVLFKNGISMVAQSGNITFSENVGAKTPADLEIPKLVWKYATTLPNLDFQGAGINPRRVITFDNQADGGRQFILETVFTANPWQDCDIAPTQATLTLLYPFKRCQLRLNISDVRLRIAHKLSVSAVLFAGNFNYPIASKTAGARLQKLNQVLEHWACDLEDFRNLINTQFLTSTQQWSSFLFQENCQN